MVVSYGFSYDYPIENGGFLWFSHDCPIENGGFLRFSYGIGPKPPQLPPSIAQGTDLSPGLQQPLDRRPRAEAQLNGAQQGSAAVGVTGIHLVGGAGWGIYIIGKSWETTIFNGKIIGKPKTLGKW